MSIRPKRNKNSESGVALIAAVLAVTILMVIGISFAFNMTLEEKAAVNFMNSVRANQIAQAGIERAIAALRIYATDQAYSNPSDDWFYQDGPGVNLEGATDPSFEYGTSGISGSFTIGNLLGTYKLKVLDTASMIYINDDNAGGRLENIMFALAEAIDLGDGINDGSPIDGAGGALIITSRPADGYITKGQIRAVGGITETEYNAIKDYITVHTWVNPATNRAPVNVNTASREVLIAVLEPLVGLAEAEAVATALEGARPIRTWAEFDAVVANPAIRDNANPNRPKPIGATTEFSFNSGGYFEIESLGRVYDLAGDLAAESKLRAVVDIFNIWHQTTQAEFDLNNKPGLIITPPGDVNVSTLFDSTCDALTNWSTESGIPSVEETEATLRIEGTGSIGLQGLNETGISKSIGAQARLILASLWIYSSDNTNDGLRLFFTDTVNNKIGPDILMDAGVVKYHDGSNYISTGGASYNGQVWYNIQIIADILAKTFDIYYETTTINNITSPQAVDLTFRETVGLTQLDRITLKTVAAAANIYVDDFKIRGAGPLNTPSANDCEPGSGVVKEWGTIAWTELGSDANKGVKIQLSSVDNPTPSDWRGAGGNAATDFFAGDFYTEASGQPIHSVHDGNLNFIKYAASLYTIDALFTACTLYDVTITYLPRTRILYWREVTE